MPVDRAELRAVADAQRVGEVGAVIGNTVGGFVAERIARSGKSAGASDGPSSAEPSANDSSDEPGPYDALRRDFARLGMTVEDACASTVMAWNSTTGRMEETGAGVGGVPETGPFTVWDNDAHTSFHAGTEAERQQTLTAAANLAELARETSAQDNAAAVSSPNFSSFSSPLNFGLDTILGVPRFDPLHDFVAPNTFVYAGREFSSYASMSAAQRSDGVPEIRAYTAQDRANAYEWQRKQAWWNSDPESALVDFASWQYNNGGTPAQIAAGGQLNAITSNLAAGHYLATSGAVRGVGGDLQSSNYGRVLGSPKSSTGIRPNYSTIADPPNLTASTKPTPRMVREMKRLNMEANGGVLRDDVTGEIMVPSVKSQRGLTPPANEVQVDHIISVDKRGTRTITNLELITRANNRAKWNK